MKNLKEQKCVACTIDAPLVDEAKYSALMSNLPDWEIEKEEINKLVKVYSFSNYQDSINFANNVAEMAEIEDHHPAILLEWGSVRVTWWSHKIKGLHMNDFICAAKTDQLKSG